MNTFFKSLHGELKPNKHSLFFKGQLLVLTGYLIAIAETIFAITFRLTPATMKDTLIISSLVLSTSLIMTIIVYFKKHLFIWQEWMMFFIYVIIYLSCYCLWIYKLGELRFLGLLNAIIAVTIVLQYTNMLQSLVMSISTFICHISIVYYSVYYQHQPGSLVREIYLASCLLPAFIVISVIASYMNRKRKQVQFAKNKLETMYNELTDINGLLRFEHSRSVIEMELARDIQVAFFPSSPPFTDDWDIALISKPSCGVSGDFFDFYCDEKKLLGISLFDVSGHGVAPALITILSRPVFYKNFNSKINQEFGAVFEASNRDLFEQLDDVHIFITGMMLRFSGNRVEYINAGHPDLLCKRSKTRVVEKITDPEGKSKGHPIGIDLNNVTYKAISFNIERGDFLLLYSDCFIDCRNCNGEYYGVNRLISSLSSVEGENSREILDYIIKDFYKFAGNVNLNDDLTLIVARKK